MIAVGQISREPVPSLNGQQQTYKVSGAGTARRSEAAVVIVRGSGTLPYGKETRAAKLHEQNNAL